MMCQTLLVGAKRTNTSLGRLFLEEVHPSARAVESLCEDHQVIGVRVAGLALMIVVSLKCTREENKIRKEHYLQMGAFFWVDGVDVGGALVGVVNVG